MNFFRPTHPLNLENSIFFFFEPFPKGKLELNLSFDLIWYSYKDSWNKSPPHKEKNLSAAPVGLMPFLTPTPFKVS